MESDVLPEDPAKQWQVLLYIIGFEEKKIDRRSDGSLENLAYFWNHKGIRHIFTEWLQQMKLKYDTQNGTESAAFKSNAISVTLREKGNVKFKAGLYDESFDLYTKSLLHAQKDSPLYSIALANRSAASFRTKQFKLCIKDVQRAFNHKYPKELRHKLYIRQAECLIELGRRRNAVEVMQAALRYEEREPLTGQSKAEFEKLYHGLEVKLSNLHTEAPKDVLCLPELHIGENPNFRGASLAIDLKLNEPSGRHVVTNQATKRGDVLFSEEPFAVVRLCNKMLPHPNYCDYCCGSEKAMIGCNDCTQTLFCDDACYYLCHVKYHRWECPGVRMNLFNIMGMAHLAFRVVLEYAHRGFPRLPERFGTPTTAARLMECYKHVDKLDSFKTDCDPFYTMFLLTSNLESSENMDNIQFFLTATMLTLYLEQYTTFFDYFPDRVGYPLPMSEMKMFAAALLFRTLGQLMINAHTVLDINTTQAIPEEPPDENIEPYCKVGSAVYPATCMMNHSCEPNITNLFYKCHLYIRGMKEFPKGTEVFNCYGPHYARESRKVRREKLRAQYGFNCVCPACSDESRKDFTLLFTAFACPACKGPVTWESKGKRKSCHQCPNEFPLQKAQNTADTADAMHAMVTCKRCHKEFKKRGINSGYERCIAYFNAALRSRTLEERCERMARAYRLMQQVLYRHHDLLRKTVDDLAKVYASIAEYSKSIELIKQNVQSFEYQYGSFSVEVTNEVRKMANMMLGRIIKYIDNPEQDERQPISIRDWMRETLKIVRKSNQLMELHYGTWQPMYKSLKNKEDLLETLLAAPRIHDSPDCINYRLQSMNII